MNRIDRQGREVRAMFDLDSAIRSRAAGSEIRPLTKMYEVKDTIIPNTSSIFKQHLHGKPSMVLLQIILFLVITVIVKGLLVDLWTRYFISGECLPDTLVSLVSMLHKSGHEGPHECRLNSR